MLLRFEAYLEFCLEVTGRLSLSLYQSLKKCESIFVQARRISHRSEFMRSVGAEPTKQRAVPRMVSQYSELFSLPMVDLQVCMKEARPSVRLM